MGKYVNSNLLPGESVIYRGAYHWTHYISKLSLFTLGLWPYLQSKCDEFVITSKRVVIKQGVFSFNILDLNIHKIESIQIQQNLIQRILGVGTIKIVATGGTSGEYEIKDPHIFRNKFLEISN